MIRLWDTVRAKRAAISAIAPLVEASRDRLGGISAAAWQEPYLLGFMAMLISLVAALHAQGRLSSDQLGLIQLEVLTRIAGVRDDRIGERICFLSARDDESFRAGCHNAWLFLRAWHGEPAPAEADDLDAADLEADILGLMDSAIDVRPFGRGGLVAAALWQRCFERHIP